MKLYRPAPRTRRALALLIRAHGEGLARAGRRLAPQLEEAARFLADVDNLGQDLVVVLPSVQDANDELVATASIGDVAATLGVSARTVRRRIAEGALPAVRVGRALRVRWDDLAEYAEGVPCRVSGPRRSAS